MTPDEKRAVSEAAERLLLAEKIGVGNVYRVDDHTGYAGKLELWRNDLRRVALVALAPITDAEREAVAEAMFDNWKARHSDGPFAHMTPFKFKDAPSNIRVMWLSHADVAIAAFWGGSRGLVPPAETEKGT